MPKKNIMIIILAVAVLLVLYLIFKSKPVEIGNKNDKPSGQTDKVDLKQVEIDYKNEVGKIIKDFSAAVQKDNIQKEDVESIKSKLFELIVPKEYKELHISILLSTNKMLDYLKTGDKELKTESIHILGEIKSNNIWLN